MKHSVKVPCKIGEIIEEAYGENRFEHEVTGFYITSKEVYILFSNEDGTGMIHESRIGLRRKKLWRENELQSRSLGAGKRWISALKKLLMQRMK